MSSGASVVGLFVSGITTPLLIITLVMFHASLPWNMVSPAFQNAGNLALGVGILALALADITGICTFFIGLLGGDS